MICDNTRCKNHGINLQGFRFCPECGASLVEQAVPAPRSELPKVTATPTPPVPLPPGYGFPAQSRNIVGGDQHITNVLNQDETKSVRNCAVSGRQAVVTKGHVCPACGLWVHEDYFDRVAMRCDNCRKAQDKRVMAQFVTKVRESLADGLITKEALTELRELGEALALSRVEQDNAIEQLKQENTRKTDRPLSIIDKTRFKSALRQLAQPGVLCDATTAMTQLRILQALHKSYPDNINIATLLLIGFPSFWTGDSASDHYSQVEQILLHSEAFAPDTPHKYLIHCMVYRTACMSGNLGYLNRSQNVLELTARARLRHHDAASRLESSFADAPECIAVQLGALLDSYYEGDTDEDAKQDIIMFLGECNQQPRGSEIEQAMQLVRLNSDEDDDFGMPRKIDPGMGLFAQLYFDSLFGAHPRFADPKRLLNIAEKTGSAQLKLECYRGAAGRGQAVAQFKLGNLYYEGESVRQDYLEAAKWFRMAAEQGYAVAQNALGCQIQDGYGVKQDYQEAAQWYEKAAEQGYASAQRNLGILLTWGDGVRVDCKEAAKWFQKAAEQGHADALFRLAVLFQHGEGVRKDSQEAAKLCKQAADLGLVEAQYYMGLLFEKGVGVKQDFIEAVKWYQKAADEGDAWAQNILGNLYLIGRGVKKDLSAARRLLQMAAEKGNENAKQSLSSIRP